MNIKNIIPWSRERDRDLDLKRDPLVRFQRDMNSLFDDFFGRTPLGLYILKT